MITVFHSSDRSLITQIAITKPILSPIDEESLASRSEYASSFSPSKHHNIPLRTPSKEKIPLAGRKRGLIQLSRFSLSAKQRLGCVLRHGVCCKVKVIRTLNYRVAFMTTFWRIVMARQTTRGKTDREWGKRVKKRKRRWRGERRENGSVDKQRRRWSGARPNWLPLLRSWGPWCFSHKLTLRDGLIKASWVATHAYFKRENEGPLDQDRIPFISPSVYYEF